MVFEDLGKALRNTDPDARTAALHQLDGIDDFGAVRMLINHARQESEEALLQLIGSITQKRNASECLDYLRRQLEGCDPEEKCRLLLVVQYFNHNEVFSIAAEQFGETDLTVARAAFQILRRLGKERVLSLLATNARSSRPETRCRAMIALAKFTNVEVIPYLHQGLGDTEYDVRKAAYDGLLRLQQAGLGQAAQILAATPRPTAPDSSEPAPVEEAEEAAPNGEAPRLTGMDKFRAEGKLCRSCNHMRRRRPDGKGMHVTRLWCNQVGKETTADKTCPRGAWTGK